MLAFRFLVNHFYLAPKECWVKAAMKLILMMRPRAALAAKQVRWVNWALRYLTHIGIALG
jgi:hypothetical protein